MLVVIGVLVLSLTGDVFGAHRRELSWNPAVPSCPMHQHFTKNSQICESTCGNRKVSYEIGYCKPFTGCVCNYGYVRLYDNATGPCIPVTKCPPIPKRCGVNEVSTSCEYVCPPQTCESIFTSYDCSHRPECFPGCNCKNNYLRNSAGKCILSDDCFKHEAPKCGPNEVATDCAIECPPQSCESLYTTYVCPTEPNCTAGCDCIDGYLRNSVGICIPSEKCSTALKCGPNEVVTDCATECPPQSCESLYTTYVCPTEPNCTAGCDCIDGYLRNSVGICIPSEECSTEEEEEPGCNGDPNAIYSDCRSACERTCASPAMDRECIVICLPGGCVCKPGYLWSGEDGECVKPEECPELSCSKNEHYVENDEACLKTCGNRLLPNEDTAGVCKPYTGCVCDDGFVREYDNATGNCIPEGKCRPIPTSCGINEEPTSCMIKCPPQTCDSIFTSYDCPEPVCEPGCNCRDNYLRNSDGICILSHDCFKPEPPKCGPNEVATDCAIECPPQSCESLYTTYVCPTEPNCTAGCDCIDGYLRNSVGICIPSEECSTEEPGCNGDPNAIYRDCRSACEPTCADPVTNKACITVCLPGGCVCKPGYLWSGDVGKCVKPEECPDITGCNGDLNATFVDCPSPCQATCSEPYSSDKICIASCEQPGCVCKSGFVLSKPGGICIQPSDCPACSVSDECKRTCAAPNPPGCSYSPPKNNINGCDCKEGYILSKWGGDCIKIEDCPTELGCNGDPHAIPKRCPLPCPSTCEAPNAQRCKKKCDPIGCECQSGYILSNSTGKCVLPHDCPGGNPCHKNEFFAQCKTDCPREYCPVNDIRGIIICDAPTPCLSGCTCELNHKRKSYNDPQCIVSSDCPPVPCTRPNEKWCPCPSACLAENCEDVNHQPVTCNTLVLNCEPACICEKDFFRNSSGICIPAKDCPL